MKLKTLANIIMGSVFNGLVDDAILQADSDDVNEEVITIIKRKLQKIEITLRLGESSTSNKSNLKEVHSRVCAIFERKIDQAPGQLSLSMSVCAGIIRILLQHDPRFMGAPTSKEAFKSIANWIKAYTFHDVVFSEDDSNLAPRKSQIRFRKHFCQMFFMVVSSVG